MASKQSITDECVEMLRVLLGRIPATDILNNQLFFDDVQYPVLEAYMQKEEDIFLPYSGVECRNMAENIGRTTSSLFAARATACVLCAV